MSKTYIHKTENAKQEFKYIGKNMPYQDTKAKAMGAAKYAIDIQLPEAYVGKLLACPYPNARIKSIDVSEAEKLPGVAAVITADDVPEKIFNPAGLEYAARDKEAIERELADMRIVDRKSHYAGEALAAVAARTEEIATQALKLIKIEYEILPFVTDLFEAIRDDAPLVHDGTTSNISQHYNDFAGNHGDVEAAFEQSALVVETHLLTSRQHNMQLEPLSCTVSFDVNGNVAVWYPNQRPFIARRLVANLLDLPEASVNIVCEHAGGFFGESNFYIVPFTLFLAKKAGKPVRMEFTREEMAHHIPSREIYYMEGKLGFTEDGVLLGGTEHVIVNSGAYFNRSNNTLPPHLGGFSSVYRMPSFRGTMDAVYTHTPFTSGTRGYGSPSALLLLACSMDMAAEKLGIDRLELRLKNFKGWGERAIQHPWETVSQANVLRQAAEKFGWEGKNRRPKMDGKWRRGIGICDYLDVSGPQPLEINDRQCVMTLEEDGSVTSTVGFPDGGMNLLGAAAQIAAETSGLRYEDFRFLHAETRGTLYDIGLGGNSGNYAMGNLFALAGKMLKDAILKKATVILGIPEDCLDIVDSVIVVKGNPSVSMSVRDLAYRSIVAQKGASEHISVTARYSAFFNPSAVGTSMADCRVDVETGDIKIDQLLICHDCGRAINPMGVEGQLQGGITMAFGYVMFEDLSLGNDGIIRGTNYNSYKLPSALDIPELDVVIYEDPAPSGPFGAKGVGQSGCNGAPGALASAIYDATGIWLEEMPFTPEKMLAAIKKQGIK